MAFKPAIATLILALFVQFSSAQSTTTVLPAQPSWSQLSAAQKAVLAPLSAEWNSFSDDRKLKWLGIINRYAKMTPVEQARIQERMREWALLSPLEREKARTQYKKLRATPAEDRLALEQRWQEYDALPGEEKERLKTARPLSRQPPLAPALTVTNQRHVPPKVVSLTPPEHKTARSRR